MSLSIGELVGYVDLDTDKAEQAAGGLSNVLRSVSGAWSSILGSAGKAAGDAAAQGMDAGLNETANDAEETGKEAGRGFSAGMKATAVAGAAGIALAFTASLTGAINAEPALDKLSASLGATGPESSRLGHIAGDLYSQAYGESLGDVSDAVASVIKNIDGMSQAAPAGVERITGSVLDLAKAFDQDLGGTTAAIGQMIKTGLAKDATEALDILTVGLQGPANKADDLMDTMNEYGTQFRKLGLNGRDAMGLIQQGLQGGARDADIVADSLKEFSLRTMGALEQADSKGVMHLTALGQAFQEVLPKGTDMYKVQEQLAKGGDTARTAFGTMLEGLNKLKDPYDKTTTAVTLFGTQAEDMGGAINSLDLGSAAGELGKVDGAAKNMGKTLNDNASTNITMFKRELQTKLVNMIGGSVLPAVTDLTGALATGLGPAFSVVGDIISDVSGYLSEHKGVAYTLLGVITALTVVTAAHAAVMAVSAAGGMAQWLLQTKLISAATRVWTAVQWALTAAMDANPIMLVVLGIAALVAAVVLAYNKVGWFHDAVDAAFSGITNAAGAVVDFVKQHWPILLAILTGPIGVAVLVIARHWDSIKSGASDVVSWIAGIPAKIGALGSRFGQAGKDLLQGFIDGMKNAAGVIAGIAGNVWDAVKGLLNGAIEKINAALEFKIDLPLGKSLTINPPDIPKLATGGRATAATLAVIGEGREPESVLPDSVLRGLLERAHAAGAASGQGGGRNAPLIGSATFTEADPNVVAEQLWFLTRTRG